jgi:hypothetical protein
MSTKDNHISSKVSFNHLFNAIGGRDFNPKNCMCDNDVNSICKYCTLFYYLKRIERDMIRLEESLYEYGFQVNNAYSQFNYTVNRESSVNWLQNDAGKLATDCLESLHSN